MVAPQPDRVAIRAHLDALFGRCAVEYPRGLCELAWSNGETWGISNAQTFPTNPTGFDEATDLAAALNAKRCNVYVGANPRRPNAPERGRCSAKDVELAFHQFIECDDPRSVALIDQAPLPPSFVIVTGNLPSPREHGYWSLPRPERDLQGWAKRQGELAKFFHSDTMIDPPRLLRLAGTINYPRPDKARKGYQTELVTLRLVDEFRTVTPG
jgi:hypothetical protein